MNPSPPPKQVRQWRNAAYLHLPGPDRPLSGLKESREFLWAQKDLEKPALDLSCPHWQKTRLILKQIYGFGFSPGLTGHDATSRFQNSSWPAVSRPGYPQEHPGLLRIARPKCLGAGPAVLRPFLVLLESPFWIRTCSKMRGKWRITQTLTVSLNRGFLLWDRNIKFNRINFKIIEICPCNKKISMFDHSFQKEDINFLD